MLLKMEGAWIEGQLVVGTRTQMVDDIRWLMTMG